MARLVILIILIYILYRLIRSVYKGKGKITRTPDGEIIDVMIQDPFCEKYIPRREAVRKIIQGKEYFFCSEECAEKYIKRGEEK